MLSSLSRTNFNFLVRFILSSANAFNFDQSKNLSFGKELSLDKMSFLKGRNHYCRVERKQKGEDARNQSLLQSFLNPFPNKPWFLRVCSTSLLKTLLEKEKLLVTSNFSFSHSVFYPFGELSAIFIKFEIVVC